MNTVFFYGLFMDADLLMEKGFNPHNVRLAELPGYRLIIGEKASLSPNKGACAYGTVMDMNSDELSALYSSQGVEDYIPQPVQVKTKVDTNLEAVTYILPMDKVTGSNAEYARNLASVANKLGLPNHYIDEIETWS